MYIYIDESGILSSGQGDFFILAAYATRDRFAASRSIKNTRQKLRKKSKQTEEIKFNNSKDEIITYLLKSLRDAEFKVYYFAYKKQANITNPKKIQMELIQALLQSIPHDVEICNVYIDNFLSSRSERDSYTDELKRILKIDRIQIVNSNMCPGVQIADFIAGTLHKNHCNPNDENGQKYYNLIKNNCIKVNR